MTIIASIGHEVVRMCNYNVNEFRFIQYSKCSDEHQTLKLNL